MLSPTLRQALSLSGAIPADRQKFMTHARTAYAEAGKPELQGLLGKLGFGPDVLTARLTELDALEASVAAAREAAGTAKGATIARNAAHKSLRQWVTALKRIARRALRTRPDLAAKLRL